MRIRLTEYNKAQSYDLLEVSSGQPRIAIANFLSELRKITVKNPGFASSPKFAHDIMLADCHDSDNMPVTLPVALIKLCSERGWSIVLE
jgi:hypothetical protein